MDRRVVATVARVVAIAMPLSLLAGCHPGLMIATGVYLWEGGNLAPAEYEFPKESKVVVFCRPPAAREFRHAGASRQISSRVTSLLRDNLKKCDVVPQRKVDEWLDVNDSEDFEELGRAVKADYVVEVDLGHFELYSGATVYQGNADVTLYVHDMNDDGRTIWDKPLGELLYPTHGPIAMQDKPVDHFQREYVEVLSAKIAQHFYKHDPHADFAIDALATR